MKLDQKPETPQLPSSAKATIILLLIAVVLLVAIIFSQIHLDNEPYACTSY